jgi:hypothetical protein
LVRMLLASDLLLFFLAILGYDPLGSEATGP